MSKAAQAGEDGNLMWKLGDQKNFN